MTVLAANDWATNADLILDLVNLRYISHDDEVLDPTFGKGVWWKGWQPNNFTSHDLDIDGVDFRDLPYDDERFDVVAYDPPYVSPGGRKTSKLKKMYRRYGNMEAPDTPAKLQQLINDGLTEVTRVTKHNGYVFVKCMDYVSSGKLWIGTHHTLTHGLSLGHELQDRLEHYGKPRAQPKRTRKDGKPSRQQHARRNLSTLLVFKVKHQ